VDPELALEPDESPDRPFLKELEYEESKDVTSDPDEADESHGVSVVVASPQTAWPAHTPSHAAFSAASFAAVNAVRSAAFAVHVAAKSL
jgi:hypothetical protein